MPKATHVLRRFLRVLALAVMLLVSCVALAQNATGRIVGSVTDPQGAVISGAKVSVANMATGGVSEATTNGEGYFEVLALPIGPYKVTVEHPGFSLATTAEKQLQINESIRFDIKLTVGAEQQTITVDAGVTGVETVSSTVGESVTGEAIKDLPLNGRDVLQLALLQPGVTPANDAALGHGFSISGGRTDTVNYLLDGGLNTDLMENTVVLNPNPDAVAEFRILTSNYSAEYGRNAGGTVSVVTKSGTNQFHGSAYDYLRNDALAANTFFNNLTGLPKNILKRNQFGATVGGPVAKDKVFFFVSYQGQKQSEGVSVNSAGQPTTNIPTFTPAELQGNFSQAANGGPDPNVAAFLESHSYFQSNPTLAAQAIIDPTTIDPVVQNYINLGLLPTSPTGLISSASDSTDNYNELTVKTDFVFSEKDRLTVTVGGHRERQVIPFGDGQADVPGFTNLTNVNTYFGSVGYNHIFSAILLNELRFTAQEQTTDQDFPQKTLASPQALGFQINPDISDGPPPIAFDSGLSLGYSSNGPTNYGDTTYSYSDTVSWTKERHTLRFGANLWTFADNFAYGYLTSGSFYYTAAGGQSSGNSFADFLLGNPEFYTQGPHAPNNVRTKDIAVFAQDDWRVWPSLTISLGLRYEYNSPKLDTLGRTYAVFPGQQSTRYPTAPVGLLFPGDAGAPRGVFFPEKDNFAPRIGFAWDVAGRHKTSLRGGFGVFYDVLNGHDNIDQNGGPPFASYVPIAYDGFGFPTGSGAPPQHFANPIGSVGLADPFPAPTAASNPSWATIGWIPWSITTTDHSLRIPYVYQYNLSLQHELARNLVFHSAYVGSSSKRLQTATQGDPLVLGTDTRVLNLAQTNASYIAYCNSIYGSSSDPNGEGACPFGNFPKYTDLGFSNYNSLQSSLTKQMGETKLGAMYFTLAYTYGHSIDNTSGRGNRSQTVPVYDPGLFRASSDFDVRQYLSLGGGWDLPFDRTWASGPKWLLKGWSLFPILSWRQEFPLNIGAQLSGGPDSPGASGAGDVGSENAIFNPSVLHITKPTLANNLQFFSASAFSNGQYQDTDSTQPDYATCAQQIPLAQSGLFPSFDCAESTPRLRTYGGPRNVIRGTGRTNLDLALGKSTQIFENLKAEMRLEAFNIFNHTEFTDPNTNIYSPQFGQVTGTYAPRIIQIALRFAF
jgi:hypothetical protein